MSEQTEKTAAFNTQPAGLEKAIHDFYTKTITLNLPVGARQWLADNVWWLALVGGILSLWGAWSYWQIGHNAAQYLDTLNQLSRAYGINNPTTNLGLTWYLALTVMAVEAVLTLLAVNKLKEKQKSGWNLLFYVSLLSVVLGVVYLLVPGYGFGSLVGVAIGALVGWFFLFQIRPHFVK